MAKLRLLATRYGAIFAHGLLVGGLLALTVHMGVSGG
jgi:hypothetical protein